MTTHDAAPQPPAATPGDPAAWHFETKQVQAGHDQG